MPSDAVSRTANVERTGRHKWVKKIYRGDTGTPYVTNTDLTFIVDWAIEFLISKTFMVDWTDIS